MRNIPIFISSTFSDMHQERDLLQQVGGLINLKIAPMGYQIVLKDLRYGIDTSAMEDEREIERKILGECFDAIESCALFVLLLGDRYGSVFEDLTIPLSYMPGMDLAGKSVTHLEVEYGILRIGKEKMLVLERDIEGDPALLPPHYRENPEGFARNRQLKDWLQAEAYLIREYSAHCGQTGIQVDEMTFMRYAWGFLTTLVENYIREQTEDAPEHAVRSEVLNDKLQQQVEKKTACYPEYCRETARGLILLRIQELLHLEDYDAINRMGSGGDAIVRYRSALIERLPEDFVGLVKEICRSIEAVVPTAPDVYAALEALSLGQDAQLALLGGISIAQLESIIAGQVMPEETEFSQWERTLEQFDGSTGKTGLERALTYFLGKNPLLIHSRKGYLFADGAIAGLIREACSREMEDQFLGYLASVFWYLPDPGKIWMQLLAQKRYALCLQGIRFARWDSRFSEAVLEYVLDAGLEQEIFPMAEDFAYWLMEKPGTERDLYWLKGLCQWVAMEDETDESFPRDCAPWIMRVYHRFYQLHKEHLSDGQLFLLDEFYHEFYRELPDQAEYVLTQQQKDRLYGLDVRYLYGADEEPAEAEENDAVAEILQRYRYMPDDLMDILWMNLHLGFICDILQRMVLEEDIWDTEDIPQVLAEYDDDGSGSFMEEVYQKLMIPLMDEGDYALAAQILRVLYDKVKRETRLRRCDWYSWLRHIPYEAVHTLARETDEEIAWEIHRLQDDFGFENLDELDEELLEAAESRYSHLK